MLANFISSFSEYAKTSLGGVLGSLRKVADVLKNEAENDLPYVDFLSSISGFFNSSYGQEFSADNMTQAIARWNSLATPGTQTVIDSLLAGDVFTLNVKDTFVTISSITEGGSQRIAIGGKNILTYTNGVCTGVNFQALQDFTVLGVDGSHIDLLEEINSTIQGSGIKAKLQVLAQKASCANWGNGDVTTYLRQLVQSLAFPTNIGTELLSLVTQGPRSLLNGIASLYEGTKRNYSDRETTGYWTDISVQAEEFSAGLVLSLVTSVLTGIGMVISMVSRVLGLIMLAVNAVIRLVAKIFEGVVEAAAGLSFSVRAGDNYSSCFSFVTSRNTISAGWIGTLLDAIGSSACTVILHGIPCVYFMLRSGSDIIIEEHLSADYSFDTLTQFQNTFDSCYVCPTSEYKRLSVLSQSNQEVLTVFNGGWNYADGSYVSAGGPTFYSSCEWNDLMSIVKHPVSFDLWDILKTTFGSDELNDTLWFRYCTALYLYFAKPMHLLMSYPGQNDELYHANGSICWASIDYSADGTSFPNSPDFRDPTVVDAVCLHDISMYRICAYVCNYLGKCFDHFYTNGTFSSSVKDGLLQLTLHLFDGLPLHNYDDSWKWMQNESSGHYPYNDCVYWTLIGHNNTLNKFDYDEYYVASEFLESQLHLWNLCPIVDEWVYDGDVTLCSTDGSYPYVTGGCAIDLPTATWSGVISGLIVDGLISVALVAVTAVALSGYIRLRNTAIQTRYKADTAAFNYGDGKGDYKTVKALNRKAKLLEFVTGMSGTPEIPASNDTDDSCTLERIYEVISGMQP